MGGSMTTLQNHQDVTFKAEDSDLSNVVVCWFYKSIAGYRCR